MTIEYQSPSTVVIRPENMDETMALDGFTTREVAVVNSQRTFDGKLTSIILEFGHERR